MNSDTITSKNNLMDNTYSLDEIFKSLPYLNIELEKVRHLFFQRCVDAIRLAKPEIEIVNSKISGKAEIIAIAYQLENISSYLVYDQENDNNNNLLKKIFKYLCGSKLKKCLCYSKCYDEFSKKKLNKKIFYFSIDLGKYICGFQSDSVPTQFPCMNSYISSDIPKDILTRTHVMSTALIISELVPDFTEATIISLNQSLKTDSQ
jgi:hypothetical protein